jgi:hypothetical protein
LLRRYLDENSQMMSILVGDQLSSNKIKMVYLVFFVGVKILFKYTCTTVTGVDFMMYELIQQRFYEMFLEKGDDTAQVLQEARANRLDAFCKLVASSMADDMKRSKGDGSSDRRKSKSAKNRSRKSTVGRKSTSSRARKSTGNLEVGGGSESDGELGRNSKGSSNGSVSRSSDYGSKSRESSFASSVMDNSIQTKEGHIVGPASIKQVMKKQASVWDLINNGQPRLTRLPINTLNAILCTPLHLKRSRSKLEIAKKMASRAEVEYVRGERSERTRCCPPTFRLSASTNHDLSSLASRARANEASANDMLPPNLSLKRLD